MPRALKPQRPQRHQAPRQSLTSYDLNRAQTNIAKTFAELQGATLQFVTRAPTSFTAPGSRGQMYLSPDNGDLWICYATNAWKLF